MINLRILFRTLVLAAALIPAALHGADEDNEIRLWPNGAPGSEGKTQKEVIIRSKSGERSVYQVHNPSITPYLPSKEKATGTAVIVIPGGGHRVLAIEHEGYNVAKKLAEDGLAAFVLKYRLARETNSTYKIEVDALADTQRAIRLVRSRAAEWNINPARVGVMGFSAGGELASQASIAGAPGKTDASEKVDQQSARPDFQALIYPGRSGDIMPNKQTPPVFLAAAYNDRKDISEGLAEVYLRYKRADVPAELHIYSSGGHGFGLREGNKKPAGQWLTRFEEWLVDSNLLEMKK